MATETGHFPNFYYIDVSGNFHLNGSKFFDLNERDISTILSQSNALTNLGSSSAIVQTTGTGVITFGSAGAYTLAAPVSGTDDGKTLTIFSTTAFAHTVTTPSNILNGNKAIATFAAAAGNGVELKASGGVWYVVRNTGITLS